MKLKLSLYQFALIMLFSIIMIVGSRESSLKSSTPEHIALLLFQQFQDLPTLVHSEFLIIKDYCLFVDVEEEKERELFRCKGEADVDETVFLFGGAVVDD